MKEATLSDVDDVVTRRRRGARAGDVITLDPFLLDPEDGFVPESLFDRTGRISFVLDAGNYLPGLHELVRGKVVGDVVRNVSIDAGWGSPRQDLFVTVPVRKLQALGHDRESLYRGATVKLRNNITVVVSKINAESDTVVLDANPPLAGSSYACSLTVAAIHDPASEKLSYEDSDELRYQMATFALDCFWGAELCFMRVLGVVGTVVGYSQDVTMDPTYEQVRSGTTRHREVVKVTFDSEIVSYESLVQVAMDRLHETQSPLHHRMFDENDDHEESENASQYRHGIYYHSRSQRKIAEVLVRKDCNRYLGIEVLQAAKFWRAEEWNQQYLYKGGQSARKGAKEPIMCFG